MQPKVHCLLGSSFTEFSKLSNIIRQSTILSSFADSYTSSRIWEADKEKCRNFFNHDLPFHQMESLLASQDPLNVCLLTTKQINIKFLKMNEIIMRRFPKVSFLLRNCHIEEDGNQTLLQNDRCHFLLISLYKSSKNEITITL